MSRFLDWFRRRPAPPPPWWTAFRHPSPWFPRLAVDPDLLERMIGEVAPHLPGLNVPPPGTLRDPSSALAWVQSHGVLPPATGDIEKFLRGIKRKHAIEMTRESLTKELIEQQGVPESAIDRWRLISGPDDKDRFWFVDPSVPFLRVLVLDFDYDHNHLRQELVGGELVFATVIWPLIEKGLPAPEGFSLQLDALAGAMTPLTEAALRIRRALPLIKTAWPLDWAGRVAEVAAPELRHACQLLGAEGSAQLDIAEGLLGNVHVSTRVLIRKSIKYDKRAPDGYRERLTALRKDPLQAQRLHHVELLI